MLTMRKTLLPSLVAAVLCTFAGVVEAAQWNVAGGGDWSIAGNWTGPGTIPPNGIDETAYFIGDTPKTSDWVVTNASGTIGTLWLEDTNPQSPSNYKGWVLQGSSLTIDVSSGNGLIHGRDSIHLVQTPLVLMDDTDIVYTHVDADQRFNFQRTISSGTGLTTNVHINRVNPDGIGSFGRVCFDTTNTFNGDVTVHSNMLQLYNGQAIPDGSNVTILAGASMRLLYNDTESINGLFGAGDVRMYGSAGHHATLDVGAAGGDGDFSGSIWAEAATYTLSLKKSGAGTQILRGASTYTAGTTISQGTLQLEHSDAAGTGTVTLGDTGTGAADVMLAVSTDFFRPIIVSALGTGTATIRGIGQYKYFRGDMTLNRPTTFSTAGTGGDWWTAFNANISGNVGLLTFEADHPNSRIALQSSGGKTVNFVGDVRVASGRLQLQGNAAIPDASSVTSEAGADLRVYESETINGLNGPAGSKVTMDHGSNSLTIGAAGAGGDFAGTIQGTGGLNKTGAGTQTLSGANTYSGVTTVSAGTLLLGDPSALGSGTSAIQLCDASTGASDVALLTDVWPAQGSPAPFPIARDIDVNNLGAGTVTIGSNAAGAGGKWVEFNGTITMNKDLHLQGINVDRTTFNGQITGTGDLYIDGPNRITFSANNDYNGDTYVTAGMAQLQNGNAIPDTSNVTVSGGATLRIWDTSEAINGLDGAGYVQIGNSSRTLTVGDGGGSGDFSGVLRNEGSGVLNLLKAGTGTQILRGASSYTGTTTVDAGTLLVNNTTGSGTGSGAVDVNPNGTLGGSGFIDGAVNVLGRIAPGNSVGTLSTGSETWAEGGIYEWEIGDVDAGAGTGWDFLSITGTLTIDATPADPFVIDIRSLDPGGAPGPVADFSPLEVYSWEIATASGGVEGFDESKFSLLRDNFQNGWQGGRWFVSVNPQGDTVFVNYAIPEPSTLVLAAFGLLGLGAAGWRRRKRTA